MAPNQIPLFAGEWIIQALRNRLNEIKGEAEALHTVTEQNHLSGDIEYICHEMLSGIQRLDLNLSRLEASVSEYRTHPSEAHESKLTTGYPL
jgi:hypothetical protein